MMRLFLGIAGFVKLKLSLNDALFNDYTVSNFK